MNSKNLSYEDISIGDSVSFERIFNEEDIRVFSEISGDKNPLHLSDEYVKTTKFKKRLVHGMLVGSLCSRLVGMYLPGKRCLYLKQSLIFKNPVFIGDTVTVKGTVISKSNSIRMIEIAILINKGEEVVIEGTASVQVL